MPFAINEATRFISPTKTPEYLAAGRPVVSTPITDVSRTMAIGGVSIADDRGRVRRRLRAALALHGRGTPGCRAADAMLAEMSWDEHVRRCQMVVAGRRSRRPRRERARVAAPAVTRGPRTRKPTLRLPDRRRRLRRLGAGRAAGGRLGQAGAGLSTAAPHIAGNAYDHHDEAGILVHRYGPHIFHTNSDEIFAYLSRFTTWRPYEHRVLAECRRQAAADPDQSHDAERTLRP